MHWFPRRRRRIIPPWITITGSFFRRHSSDTWTPFDESTDTTHSITPSPIHSFPSVTSRHKYRSPERTQFRNGYLRSIEKVFPTDRFRSIIIGRDIHTCFSRRNQGGYPVDNLPWICLEIGETFYLQRNVLSIHLQAPPRPSFKNGLRTPFLPYR